jgi:hypothetical protein
MSSSHRTPPGRWRASREARPEGVPAPARALAPALSLIALLAAAGCSEITLPAVDGGIPYSILVLPADVTLSLVEDVVQTQRYRACGYFYGTPPVDGSADAPPKDAAGPEARPPDATHADSRIEEGGVAAACPSGTVDISDKVKWEVELTTIGSFSGSQFRTEVVESGKTTAAHHGGTTRVSATLASSMGYGNLTVSFKKTFYGGSASASSASLFTGTVSSVRTPTIVYPATGVVVPPNLGQMEVQWSKVSTNDLYHLSFASTLARVDIYTTEVNHPLTHAEWQAVAETSREDTVSIGLEATASTAPSTRGVATAVAMKVAKADVKGGLYYWVILDPSDTTADSMGIYRYNFDSFSESSEAYYTKKQAGDCIGCHALSRGGDMVAFTKSGGRGDTEILDVKTRTPVIDKKYKADIHTFSSDGSEVIVANEGYLYRRKVKDGSLVETIATGTGKATHPDWSEDGLALVYVLVPAAYYEIDDNNAPLHDDVHFKYGSIYLLKRETTSSAWGTPTLLVAGGSGANNYYPSFSPKGDYIVFNRSSGDSYSDEDANVYLIKPDGTGLRALASISGTKTSNSWPRWSPFVQKWKSTTLYWLTFASVRDYGTELVNSSQTLFKKKVPQVWMAAFDTEVAKTGADPVYPPFWLPFQSLKTHNHIAQWTQKVVSMQ